MPADTSIANKAMEGSGFYNRNSNLQAAGIELALPLLEEAARAVPADGQASEPLVITDYGSSQGRNSMRPIKMAIDILRARMGPARPIEVVHTDLPTNDFAALFTTLQEDSSSYLAGRKGVFPSAVGCSYFQSILPPGRVNLGWNSWTLHWLSRNPVEVDDHVMASRSSREGDREAVRRQLVEDWTNFLAARSTEMAEGARFVSLMVGRSPEQAGWQWIFDELWQAAQDMAAKGLLTQTELRRLTFPTAPRTAEDIAEPFVTGSFHGLSLEHAKVIEMPDPFWEEFLRTGNALKLGKQWAGTIRAIGGPLAAAAFAQRPHPAALVDELFARFEERAAAEPRKNLHYAAIAVIRKNRVR